MNPNEFFLFILTSVLVNNFLLVQFLDVNPFLDASKKLESAIRFAGVMILFMTLASIFSFAIDHWILSPLGLVYFRTLSFILVILILALLVKILLKKINLTLYSILDTSLPLIVMNSAILGVAVLNIQKSQNIFESTLYGLSSALGFSLVLILFSAMRVRLVSADVPAPFKGTAIEMFTLGFASLAFIGFAGLGN